MKLTVDYLKKQLALGKSISFIADFISIIGKSETKNRNLLTTKLLTFND